MTTQKLTDDDKKCIRNNINYSQNCNQNTDGKCSYSYKTFQGDFNCRENDFFNVIGTDLVFQCPSTFTGLGGSDGYCEYKKTTKPMSMIYIIISIFVIAIFVILFFTLRNKKSSKNK